MSLRKLRLFSFRENNRSYYEKNSKGENNDMKRSKQKNIQKETRKNKLYASMLLVLGVIPLALFGDGSGLIIVSIFAIPLIFAKKNYIM